MKVWCIIFLMAVIGNAQTFSISGTVKDTAGTAVSDVLVRLGIADISTTTGSDGRFSLETSKIRRYPIDNLNTSTGKVSFRSSKNGINIRTAVQSSVRFSVYSTNGALCFSRTRLYTAGMHTLPLPRLAPGMHIYHVTINNRTYIFKCLTGLSPISAASSPASPRTALHSARRAESVDDALLFTKQGFTLIRIPLAASDTSGIEVTLLPLETGTVTDIENNVYRTVKIGSQEWTAENIRTTKYRDGTAIPFDTASATWENATTPKYCYYGNTTDPDSIKKFGALYNWYVVDTANENNIAPEGWHVPTDAEWDTLHVYLIANGYNWDGTLMGSKMAKSMAAETDWNTSLNQGSIGCDLSQNNTCGFSALPGGERNLNGDYYNIGSFGYWLSTTEIDETNAYSRDFCSDWGHTYRDYGNKSCGFSVRLVRDTQ